MVYYGGGTALTASAFFFLKNICLFKEDILEQFTLPLNKQRGTHTNLYQRNTLLHDDRCLTFYKQVAITKQDASFALDKDVSPGHVCRGRVEFVHEEGASQGEPVHPEPGEGAAGTH